MACLRSFDLVPFTYFLLDVGVLCEGWVQSAETLSQTKLCYVSIQRPQIAPNQHPRTAKSLFENLQTEYMTKTEPHYLVKCVQRLNLFNSISVSHLNFLTQIS